MAESSLLSDGNEFRESGPSALKNAAVAGAEVVLVVLICGLLRLMLERAAWFRSFEDRHEFWAFSIPTWVVLVGYSIGIVSLAILLILSQLAPGYVALVLPIALTVTLLTPSVLFNRLDRQAGADE